MTSLPLRIAAWAIAFVVGVVYGAAGTIAHAFSWGPVPVGLILAMAGCAALLIAVRLLVDRWAALATGLGMMLATLVFSGTGPGGSVIVPQTALATVWTLALPIIVAIAVAWPERVRSVAAA